MKQKILIVMYALMFCMGAKAVRVTIDGLVYEIYVKQNYAEVVDGKGNNNVYAYIPSKVTYKDATYPVTKIGARCFQNCDKLEKVTIPSTVTSIGNHCFKECYYLKSVNIPSSVTTLGDNCFDGCRNLESVSIPSSITYLGKSCFFFCKDLTSVSIPSSVTVLRDSCFAYTGLTSIDIPSSVKSIGNDCFASCDFTSVSIPSSVTHLGARCFDMCVELTSVTIPSSVTSIGDGCFSSCWKLPKITIPSSVTSLGKECFSYCKALTSVALPNSLTSLGESCFSGCKALTSIILPSSIESLGKKCFSDCWKLSSIVLPSSLESIESGCFNSCSSLYEVTCRATTPPSAGSAFPSAQVSAAALLFVPKISVEAYKSAYGWRDFKSIYPIEDESGDDGEETQPCETPTIGYADGKLVFSSSTAGAEYHYTVKAVDNQTEAYSEGEAALAACYDISCYATADGYKRSAVATAKLYWVSASVVTDGITPGVQMRGVVISTDGGMVTLSGLADGERVTFYNVGGMKIGEAKAINGSASLAVADEVVIVRIGTQTVKIKM